jgi:hypothetical protein
LEGEGDVMMAMRGTMFAASLAVAAGVMTGASQSAEAQCYFISPPVYSSPVYVAPAPVYVAPPVFVAPRPVYYGYTYRAPTYYCPPVYRSHAYVHYGSHKRYYYHGGRRSWGFSFGYHRH